MLIEYSTTFSSFFLKNKPNYYFKSSINVRIYYLNSMQIYYNAKLTSAALSLLDQVI